MFVVQRTYREEWLERLYVSLICPVVEKSLPYPSGTRTDLTGSLVSTAPVSYRLPKPDSESLLCYYVVSDSIYPRESKSTRHTSPPMLNPVRKFLFWPFNIHSLFSYNRHFPKNLSFPPFKSVYPGLYFLCHWERTLTLYIVDQSSWRYIVTKTLLVYECLTPLRPIPLMFLRM